MNDIKTAIFIGTDPLKPSIYNFLSYGMTGDTYIKNGMRYFEPHCTDSNLKSQFAFPIGTKKLIVIK